MTLSASPTMLLSLLLPVVAALSPDCETRPWAVVTGASSGIGRAIALEAANRGFNVAALARRKDQLQTLVDEIKASNTCADALPIVSDLTQSGSAAKVHSATKHLTVDLLVANAGFAWVGDFVDQPTEKIASMLAVNMAAPAELCRLYGADMAAAGRGALLLTSSLTAFAPLPGSALYGASRAFIHSLAGGLAEELAPRGVKVRCVLPGSTDTGFSGTGSTEQSLAFTGPLFRPTKIITPAEWVAAAGISAVLDEPLGGRVEAFASFMQRVYATTARAVLPRARAGTFAGIFFGPVSPLSSVDALVPAAAPLLIAAVPLLVVALPLTLVQELLYALPGPAFYVVLLAALYALRRAWRPDAAPAKRKAKTG